MIGQNERGSVMERSCQGWTQKDIAHVLGVNPKTISRYLQGSSAQIHRRRYAHNLDPFKSYLLQRWNEGCHNATQLFREIKPEGYPGEVTMVRLFARQLRKASGMPPNKRAKLTFL
jgi:transposase